MSTPIRAAIPLYHQVAEKILLQLAEGALKPGQYLPGEWDLARQWHVSQGTVRKGLGELVTQGILSRQQGVGTYVTHKNPEWGDYPLVDGNRLLEAAPLQIWPRAEVLSVTSVSADDETAARLRLRARESVWKLVVLWRNGHQAVAVDEAFLPLTRLPDLNVHFAHRRLSIYSFIQLHYGLVLRPTSQFLALQNLREETARLLKADARTPAWCWYRLSEVGGQLPVEWRRRHVVPGSLLLQTAGMAAV